MDNLYNDVCSCRGETSGLVSLTYVVIKQEMQISDLWPALSPRVDAVDKVRHCMHGGIAYSQPIIIEVLEERHEVCEKLTRFYSA